MPKLAKNYYRTSKGDKRVNCYMANIPKEVVSKTEISEDDDINIYAEDSKIIIERKEHHFVCMGCGCEWEDSNKQTICPKCKVANIYMED